VDPRIARRAAAAALVLGVIADVVFDRTALGINVPLATLLILAVATTLSASHRPADRIDLWLPIVAIVASLGPALRTDPSVVALDLTVDVIAIAGWSLAVRRVAVTRRTATGVAWLGAEAVIAVTAGFAWLIARSGTRDAGANAGRHLRRVAPIARGALIAVPVLAGFTVLLGSADAVFGRAVADAFRFPLDVGDLANRAWFAVVAATLVGGPLAIATGGSRALLTSLAGFDPYLPAAPRPGTQPAGGRPFATEMLVVIVAVDALFAAFATVQVLFLFGGASTLSAIGMSYSDYARQGYFQLVFVVGLAGLLLLGAHEVVGRTRRFLVPALALLVLTGVILASAAVRLALYQGAYGWTELRFFVAASIAWLGLCVTGALVALALDRMRWLPHAIALSAMAVTLAVSGLGPQAFVMRQNLGRVLDPSLIAAGGHAGLDLEYAAQLGDDAIPDLVAALAVVPAADRPGLQILLERRRAELVAEVRTGGPLTWNLSRARALEALDDIPEGQ
jgi:hypothetical protein